MERFIKFNNEVVEAGELLHFERVAQAWMRSSEFALSERQLLELNPADRLVAISVFWRHRTPAIQHAGRVTDVLLLTLGFYKEFNLKIYQEFLDELRGHRFEQLAKQLLFLLEEIRFTQQITRHRKGTANWFQLRHQAVVPYYKQQLSTLQKRGFTSDALLYFIAIAFYEGTLHVQDVEEFNELVPFLNQWRKLSSTEETIDTVWGILFRVEGILSQDAQLTHFQHLVLRGSEFENFTYHRGLKKKVEASKESKESVEEMMQMWHQESEQEKGLHLRFEIEHGRDSDLADPDGAVEEGREDHEPTSIGLGNSSSQSSEDYDMGQLATGLFPRIHDAVVAKERLIEVHDTTNFSAITKTRLLQSPYVKQLVTLFEKEMAKKEIDIQRNLSKGRLQKNLLPLWLEERPRIFYRKGQDSRELDAVFYLLVDGSASMQDKLEETKEAVLYVHDVLRKLRIPHRIVQHYEDAYDATESFQPNYFEVMHEYDLTADAAPSIYSMEAHEDNRDGYALRKAGHSLLARPESQKFLLYFSDGEPSAFEYREKGILDTADAVQWLEKKGIGFLHLYLSDTKVTEEQQHLFSVIYGKRTAATDSLDQLTSEAHRLLKRMLQHALMRL